MCYCQWQRCCPSLRGWRVATAVLLLAALQASPCQSRGQAATGTAEAAAPTSNVSVRLGAAVAPATGDAYVGYTMDYWNASQGNNWLANSSVLSFPLHDDALNKLTAQLAPAEDGGHAMFRIGGTTADYTDYEVGGESCSSSVRRNCLGMERWLAVLRWAKRVRTGVVFTLNGLRGRNGSRAAPWDSRNAAAFLEYTKLHAPHGVLQAVGLGNELTNGNCPTFPNCPPQVLPAVYAKDVLTLRGILDRVWADEPALKPLLVAPDAGYATNLNMTLQLEYFDTFLRGCGHAVDRVSYHMYIEGGNDPNLAENMLSVAYLDEWNPKFPAQLLPIVQRRAPAAAAAGLWADEIAAAWGSCGGGSGEGAVVCDKFMDSYWYLHQLGTLAKLNHSLFARQTLRGGYYELINQTSNKPHPDYFVALLWQRLMTRGHVLNASVAAHAGDGCGAQVRAFAHCLPGEEARAGGAVAVALLNLCMSADVLVHVELTLGASATRDEYVLTPCAAGAIHESCVALNGAPLHTSSTGDLPRLDPRSLGAHEPLVLPAGALAWVVLPAEGVCT